MDYYLNEYSLRGQFSSYEEFFSFCAKNVLPVIDKIESDNDQIYKKEDYWNLPVCGETILENVLKYNKQYNHRYSRYQAVHKRLQKLVHRGPYIQSEDTIEDIRIREHFFDTNSAIETDHSNSFYQVAANIDSGRLVSFVGLNDIYSHWSLRLKIEKDNADSSVDTIDIDIKNAYDNSCWSYFKEVKKWPIIDDKYIVSVRADECDRHEPHFHVSDLDSNAMVFSIRDCSILAPDPEKKDHRREQWQRDMCARITKWYLNNMQDLKKAWNILQPEPKWRL